MLDLSLIESLRRPYRHSSHPQCTWRDGGRAIKMCHCRL